MTPEVTSSEVEPRLVRRNKRALGLLDVCMVPVVVSLASGVTYNLSFRALRGVIAACELIFFDRKHTVKVLSLYFFEPDSKKFPASKIF